MSENRFVKSKVLPRYSQSLDREYERIVRAYLELFFQEFKKIQPELESAVERLVEPQNGIRMDAEEKTFKEILNNLKIRFENKAKIFNLGKKIYGLAIVNRKMSVRQWKKIVKKTLGINIFDDYYLGDFYKEQMGMWIQENVDLIKSIPEYALGRMEKIVYDGWNRSQTIKTITDKILSTYGVSKSKARLLARDQMAKLSADISKAQMLDAGVQEYIWSTSKDARVREGHKRLEGKRFSWDNPPIVDDKTGRRCHPAEDYQCRCVAIPVFDLNNLKLPIDDKPEKGAVGYVKSGNNMRPNYLGG